MTVRSTGNLSVKTAELTVYTVDLSTQCEGGGDNEESLIGRRKKTQFKLYTTVSSITWMKAHAQLSKKVSKCYASATGDSGNKLALRCKLNVSHYKKID